MDEELNVNELLAFYLEQRRVLNEGFHHLTTRNVGWTGYLVAHRDLKAELVRIDAVIADIVKLNIT